MKVRKKINILRRRRDKRVKMRITKAGKPRLSIFRSHRHIYAQIIDDQLGKTLVSASSMEIKEKTKKTEKALALGKRVAEKALKVGTKSVVLDRGRYRYHGRVKAVAEGARSGGLKF